MSFSKDVFEIIDIDKLVPSADNPRKSINEKELNNLAESIKTAGIINPITIRKLKKNGKFEIISGERRFKAAGIAGLKQIPCIIREITDEQMYEIQIIENLQRSDIHPMDEAYGFKNLIDKSKYDIKSLGQKVGKSEAYVYSRLKLLDLIKPAIKAFTNDLIIFGHALILCKLPKEQQEEAYKYLVLSYNGRPVAKEEIPTVHELMDWVNQNVLLDLNQAPFPKDAKKSAISTISCLECSKRTGFNKNLFPELNKKDICTDPICFNKKLEVYIAAKKKEFTDKKIKVVEISDWYKTNTKNVLGMSEYEIITSKKCPDVVKGLFVEGSSKGEFVNICANKECKVHHEHQNYQAQTITPDSRYKRKLELIHQPEANEWLIAISKKLFKSDSAKWNIEEITKEIINQFLIKLHFSEQEFILKNIFGIDTDANPLDFSVISMPNYHKLVESLDKASLINFLLIIALNSSIPLNTELQSDSNEFKYFLEFSSKLIDIEPIKKDISVKYDEQRARVLDRFIKRNGYKPGDKPKKKNGNEMADKELKRRCNNCKFFMTRDSGYSNYTVSETTVFCLKNKNKYLPCEESYSWKRADSPDYEILRVAEACEDFVPDAKDESLWFDVEGEFRIDDCKDEEIKEAYNKWLNENI